MEYFDHNARSKIKFTRNHYDEKNQAKKENRKKNLGNIQTWSDLEVEQLYHSKADRRARSYHCSKFDYVIRMISYNPEQSGNRRRIYYHEY